MFSKPPRLGPGVPFPRIDLPFAGIPVPSRDRRVRALSAFNNLLPSLLTSGLYLHVCGGLHLNQIGAAEPEFPYPRVSIKDNVDARFERFGKDCASSQGARIL